MESKTWRAYSLNRKVKVVCHDCNNGWMSQLEEHYAKPAMKELIRRGSDTFLLPKDILSICHFAFKHAVVADHAGLGTMRPFFSEDIRSAFRSSRAVPIGIHMWISRFNSRDKGFFRSTYHTFASELGRGTQFYVFTYVAGFLALQVVAQGGSQRNGQRIPLGKLTQNPAWDAFSMPIWPSDGHAICWPPPRNLNKQIIEEFCDRFRDIKLSLG